MFFSKGKREGGQQNKLLQMLKESVTAAVCRDEGGERLDRSSLVSSVRAAGDDSLPDVT